MSQQKLPNCKCQSLKKEKDLYYDAVKTNLLKLVSAKTEDYVETAQLVCNLCTRNWIFTRDDSYHEPSVEWSEKNNH